MPPFTLVPNSTSSTDSTWARTGGSTKHGVVADVSDATYVSRSAAGVGRQGFGHPTLPADAAAVDSPLNLNARVRSESEGNNKLFAYVFDGASTYRDTADYNPEPDQTNIDHVFTLANPTLAETSTHEYGVGKITTVSGNLRCIKFDSSGTYVQSGSSAILIYNVLGPLLGAHVLLEQLPAISALMRHLRQPEGAFVWFNPHEFLQAFRDLRAYPHRRFVLPAAR